MRYITAPATNTFHISVVAAAAFLALATGGEKAECRGGVGGKLSGGSIYNIRQVAAELNAGAPRVQSSGMGFSRNLVNFGLRSQSVKGQSGTSRHGRGPKI